MATVLIEIDLHAVSIEHGKEFLVREEVAADEAEMAFAGFCVGFCEGYALACEHISEKLKGDGNLQ